MMIPFPGNAEKPVPSTWQKQAVAYARLMSRVRWTPVAEGMPQQGHKIFEPGKEYVGVPYSNQTHEGRVIGRTIGFDIFLKTFLAAVENPRSVLYTERIPHPRGGVKSYYGMVCSSFTSYALQCGWQYVARHHVPHYGEGAGPERAGVVRVEPQAATVAAVGDIVFTPAPGQHVEIVTEVLRGADGAVTHVRVEDSWPPTVRDILYRAEDFNARITSRNRALFRITDHDAWRADNRADPFLFPNYEEDAAAPVINRALLLDRGDWVPYFRDQEVGIHVMDRDARGVEALVIRRGDDIIETTPLAGTGELVRSFAECGDYRAQVVHGDGSSSQACEFSISDLVLEAPGEVALGASWDIAFSSCHMNVVYVRLSSEENPYGRYVLPVSDRDRARGSVRVPAGLLQEQDRGVLHVRLFGENRYGRLHRQQSITVTE